MSFGLNRAEVIGRLGADVRAYRIETGEVWRPRSGSHTSQTGQLTSAAIDARDFQRARKDRENKRAPARGNAGGGGGRQADRRSRYRHRHAR